MTAKLSPLAASQLLLLKSKISSRIQGRQSKSLHCADLPGQLAFNFIPPVWNLAFCLNKQASKLRTLQLLTTQHPYTKQHWLITGLGMILTEQKTRDGWVDAALQEASQLPLLQPYFMRLFQVLSSLHIQYSAFRQPCTCPKSNHNKTQWHCWKESKHRTTLKLGI